MPDTLPARLADASRYRHHGDAVLAALLAEAARELDRLRAELARLRQVPG